jgi:hypothetical protein
LSDAIPPPGAKVERTPLDNNATDRIDVAEHPLTILRRRRENRRSKSAR